MTTRWRWFLIYALSLLAIIVLSLLPLVSVLYASYIAEAHGCRVDEGGTYPCIVDGQDIGGTLSTLAVMGWLLLITLPLGAFMGLIWMVVVGIHIIRSHKNAAGAPYT